MVIMDSKALLKLLKIFRLIVVSVSIAIQPTVRYISTSEDLCSSDCLCDIQEDNKAVWCDDLCFNEESDDIDDSEGMKWTLFSISIMFSGMEYLLNSTGWADKLMTLTLPVYKSFDDSEHINISVTEATVTRGMMCQEYNGLIILISGVILAALFSLILLVNMGTMKIDCGSKGCPQLSFKMGVLIACVALLLNIIVRDGIHIIFPNGPDMQWIINVIVIIEVISYSSLKMRDC